MMGLLFIGIFVENKLLQRDSQRKHRVTQRIKLIFVNFHVFFISLIEDKTI
jgi:hypothetical protein